MKGKSLRRVLFAGLFASIGMLVALLAMPLFNAPKLDVFDLVSTLSTDYNWWAEPLEYLALGAVLFPILFAYMLYDNLPGKTSFRKGLAWGLILWALREFVVSPILGQGILSMQAPHPVATVIEMVIAHLIYGAILGSLAVRHLPLHRHTRQTQNAPIR